MILNRYRLIFKAPSPLFPLLVTMSDEARISVLIQDGDMTGDMKKNEPLNMNLLKVSN